MQSHQHEIPMPQSIRIAATLLNHVKRSSWADSKRLVFFLSAELKQVEKKIRDELHISSEFMCLHSLLNAVQFCISDQITRLEFARGAQIRLNDLTLMHEIKGSINVLVDMTSRLLIEKM